MNAPQDLFLFQFLLEFVVPVFGPILLVLFVLWVAGAIIDRMT